MRTHTATALAGLAIVAAVGCAAAWHAWHERKACEQRGGQPVTVLAWGGVLCFAPGVLR